MSLKFTQVEFCYPSQNSHKVLNIPEWSVASGETVFVQGSSGSGKSTLLHLIAGLLIPNSGEVRVLDTPLQTLTGRQRDRFRARYIGCVFQQFNLIPYLNAIDNIRLVQKFAQQPAQPLAAIEQLLDELNITAQQWLLPVRQLSMGQQQRIGIARALINQPQFIIADEPTASLDEANAQIFMELLMSLVQRRRMTLIFVSHDERLAHYFNRYQALSGINHIKEQAHVD